MVLSLCNGEAALLVQILSSGGEGSWKALCKASWNKIQTTFAYTVLIGLGFHKICITCFAIWSPPSWLFHLV